MTALNRYYFVMWPDEQDTAVATGSSSTHSESPITPPKTLIRSNGRSSTSSDEGTTEGSRALIPVAHLVRPVILSREMQQMQSHLQPASPPLSSIRTCSSVQRVFQESMFDGGTVVAVSAASMMAGSSTVKQCCSKCLLKDSENRQLKKRVQALEGQLCRALGSKKPKMESTVIALSPQAVVPIQIRNQIATGFTSESRVIGSPSPVAMTAIAKVQPMEVPAVTLANNSPARPREKFITATVPEDDRIELIPGTNVFISTSKLQQILSVVKTGKQLARKLMSVYWDRMTLARSTLSASSQHYEQLDPNTISAIKTYCVLFDNSSRKSEIHSTMIDKCVQARRPRRSSLRQLEHITCNKVEYAETGAHLHPNITVHQPRQEDSPTLVLYHQQKDGDISTPLGLNQSRDEDSDSPTLVLYDQQKDRDVSTPLGLNQSRDEDSESPTLVLYHQQKDRDVPTTLGLNQSRDEDSESPTLVLYHQQKDRYIPTPLGLNQSRDEDSESPTVVLYHQQKDGDVPTPLGLNQLRDADSESSIVVTPVLPSHNDNIECDEG